MNSKENSTGLPERAIRIQSMIDNRAGLLSQAARAKHLSSILMTDLEGTFDLKRARKTEMVGGYAFEMRVDNIDTTLWAMSELWDASRQLFEQMEALADAVDGLREASQ